MDAVAPGGGREPDQHDAVRGPGYITLRTRVRGPGAAAFQQSGPTRVTVAGCCDADVAAASSLVRCWLLGLSHDISYYREGREGPVSSCRRLI